MRNVINFNSSWKFSKRELSFKDVPTGDVVDLPHTWNGEDGQDGGGDYYRGKCYYAKEFDKSILPEEDLYFLEIKGANSKCEVMLNGKTIAEHDGGYSTFRTELRNLEEHNLLIISVDNSPSETSYPQFADFTFYGGLYRDVNIVCVPFSHFELEYWGGPGMRVTPKISGNCADVEIEAYLKNEKRGQMLEFKIFDDRGTCVSSKILEVNDRKAHLKIEDVKLWCGIESPTLYRAEIHLLSGGEVIDKISSNFGCREFKVDSERGFILNGKEYPLRGVSRHQDRPKIGNALKAHHHEEDVKLILEMGANCVRLAHYQHDEYFYELCDKAGLVVWAEIPYISRHNPKAKENTVSQMHELVIQNYNHPSICFWGISNEITMGGEDDESLISNHILLNGLCHSLDETRPTTVAAISMCKPEAEYLRIPDLVAYNHYFGWYGGDVSMNGVWFDSFHEKYPEIPIGISEYGCEALNWHTSEPKQGDYTEEYQAYYHEELIKQIEARPYLWATFVWNMFDFAADARNEGGEGGMNHKGLVSFDRKYKKDSFYAYRAWLSKEPFVHIGGKRYAEREEETTEITVYSNLPEVELFANGKSLGKKTGKYFFKFRVQNKGETKLLAKAGNEVDESLIVKVDKFQEKYRLCDIHAVLNWFDIKIPVGKLSLNDKISDVMDTAEGRALFAELFAKTQKGTSGTAAMPMPNPDDMMELIGGFTVIRFLGMSEMLGLKLNKSELLSINEKLNKIDKTKK